MPTAGSRLLEFAQESGQYHAGFRFHRNHSVDASIGCRAIGAIALYNLGLIAGYVEDLPILFRLDFDSVSNTLDGLQTCKSTAALVAIID